MKKILLVVIALAISLTASGLSSYEGIYTAVAKRYTDSVVLDKDGFGRLTHKGKTNSSYDYNIKMSWKYDASKNKIITKSLENDSTGWNSQTRVYSIHSNSLTLDGGVGLVFQK